MENETMEVQGEGGQKKSKRKSKKMVIGVIVVVIVIAALFFCKSFFIAASVNGSYISRASVVRELEKKSGKQLLDVLITQRLVTNEAKKQGVKISDEELNARIKGIEDGVTKQGGKIADLLAAQGLTEKTFHEQVVLEMKLEKLIGDKAVVTDEEVDAYIKENKVPLPKGKEAEMKGQIKDELKGAKLNKEAGTFVESLRKEAKIQYFGSYVK